MITGFVGACVLFWLWRLTRRWDRPPVKEMQPACPLPVRKPAEFTGPIPFWHPWNKSLDIPPVIR